MAGLATLCHEQLQLGRDLASEIGTTEQRLKTFRASAEMQTRSRSGAGLATLLFLYFLKYRIAQGSQEQ